MNTIEKFHIHMGCGEPLQSRDWVVRSVAQPKDTAGLCSKPVVSAARAEPLREGKRRS